MSLIVSIYDDNNKGIENRICFWLRLDSWHLCEAAMVFVDIDPDTTGWRGKADEESFNRFETFRRQSYNLFADEDSFEFGAYEVREMIKKYGDMHRILFNPDVEYDTPNNWIERAIAKKVNIPWLEFAIRKGFYVPKKNDVNKQVAEKPLSDKERETLLIIIAALAKEAKIDINKASKAGELIANLTQQIGASVGATTIETHLKKISQALENRAK